MFASLYVQQRRCPPFADFRVNLRDGTTGVFACQRYGCSRSGSSRDSLGQSEQDEQIVNSCSFVSIRG